MEKTQYLVNGIDSIVKTDGVVAEKDLRKLEEDVEAFNQEKQEFKWDTSFIPPCLPLMLVLFIPPCLATMLVLFILTPPPSHSRETSRLMETGLEVQRKSEEAALLHHEAVNERIKVRGVLVPQLKKNVVLPISVFRRTKWCRKPSVSDELVRYPFKGPRWVDSFSVSCWRNCAALCVSFLIVVVVRAQCV